MVITQNKSLRIWSTVKVSWVRRCSRNVTGCKTYKTTPARTWRVCLLLPDAIQVAVQGRLAKQTLLLLLTKDRFLS